MTSSHLASWGYGPFFAQAFSQLAQPELTPARVVSDLGARLEVADAMHPARLAQPSGRLRHTATAAELPTVGDWVAITAPPGTDDAVIHHVLPRRTRLVRRAAGRGPKEQVVAANVDTFFIVTSANRDARARRIERYLTAAWDSGATPVVVVSKVDLVEADALEVTLAALTVAAPGVAIAAVSAHTGAGLDELDGYLRPGHTVALIGSSGVGKSSLVNHWLGIEQQIVLPIDDHDRGRHATRRRELFALPTGGLVIDTPGMRELGLLDSDTGLEDAFADITALAARCRFRNCHHAGEPGCAVDAAIDTGELDPARLASMRKLARELAFIERRYNRAAARAERSHSKLTNKAPRARGRYDPKLQR